MTAERLAIPAIVVLLIGAATILFTPYAPYAPLAILAALGGAALWRWPVLAIAALVGLAPFAQLTEQLPVSLPKLVGAAAIGVLALQFLLRLRPLSLLKTRLWWPIGAFLAVNLLGATIVGDSPLEDETLRRLYVAVATFAIVLACAPQLRILTAAAGLAIAVTIPAACSLVLDTGHPENGRAMGFVNDPNIFAMLIVAALPLTLGLARMSTTRWTRAGWLAAALVQGLAFLDAGSRAGLVVLLFLFLFVAGDVFRGLVRASWRLRIGAGVAALGLAVIAVIASPPDYAERLARMTDVASTEGQRGDRSLARRQAYIEIGGDMVRRSPLIGEGPGSFPAAFARSGDAVAYASREEAESAWRQAHNSYVEIAAENGLLGLAAFLALTGMTAWNFRRVLIAGRQHPSTAVAAKAFLLSFVGVAAFLFFVSRHTFEIYWFLAALSVIWVRRIETVAP